MQLKSRLKKLEMNQPKELDLPIILHRVQGAKDGKPDGEPRYEIAQLPGTGLGILKIREGEAETVFVRRIHAIRFGGKHVEDMTLEELAAAYEWADKEMGKDNANNA